MDERGGAGPLPAAGAVNCSKRVFGAVLSVFYGVAAVDNPTVLVGLLSAVVTGLGMIGVTPGRVLARVAGRHLSALGGLEGHSQAGMRRPGLSGARSNRGRPRQQIFTDCTSYQFPVASTL